MKKTLEKNKQTVHKMEDYFYYLGFGLFLLIIIIYAANKKQLEFGQKIKLPPCFFHLVTGYFCPGCGGTRAVEALFRGKILKSLYYHPVVIYGAGLYLCFMVTQTAERISRHKIRIGMHYRNGYLWAAVVIILVNFVLRNALHYFCGYYM